MTKNFIWPMLVFAATSLLVWLIFRLVMRRIVYQHTARPTWRVEAGMAIFFMYMIVVGALTIVPYPFFFHQHDEPYINLVPLVNTLPEFLESFHNETNAWSETIVQNVVGNVLLFLPFGFLVPLREAFFRSLKRIIICAAAISVTIELLQWFSSLFHIYRSVDIDDVILNITGAAIGYGFYRLSLKIFGRNI